jgi:type II restriction enzyme
VVDGAYETMMDRLGSPRSPSLFLLNYDQARLEVSSFLVVPSHFFVPSTIERRKPLSASARRAGWIGCNIVLHQVPEAGRIFLVMERTIEPRSAVLAKWQRMLFLRDQTDVAEKGWLLNVMKCIEAMRQPTFSLGQLYAFEAELSRIYPGNRHIRPKIRQQLQVLRDKGYLDFLGNGWYKMAE